MKSTLSIVAVSLLVAGCMSPGVPEEDHERAIEQARDEAYDEGYDDGMADATEIQEDTLESFGEVEEEVDDGHIEDDELTSSDRYQLRIMEETWEETISEDGFDEDALCFSFEFNDSVIEELNRDMEASWGDGWNPDLVDQFFQDKCDNI